VAVHQLAEELLQQNAHGFDVGGQLAAADLDGDGLIEVLAPAYDKHQIHVYTLRQAARRQPAKRS
jgi:hypothetical protein